MVSWSGIEEAVKQPETGLEKYPGVASAQYGDTPDGRGLYIKYEGDDEVIKSIVESGEAIDVDNIIGGEVKPERRHKLNESQTFAGLLADVSRGVVTIYGREYNVKKPFDLAKDAYSDFDKEPWVDEQGRITSEPQI